MPYGTVMLWLRHSDVLRRCRKVMRCVPLAERNVEKSTSRSDVLFSGAGNRIRTDDLLITNQLLYQLSHTSNGIYYTIPSPVLQVFFSVSSENFENFQSP